MEYDSLRREEELLGTININIDINVGIRLYSSVAFHGLLMSINTAIQYWCYLIPVHVSMVLSMVLSILYQYE